MTKRITSVLLIFVLLLAAASCNRDKGRDAALTAPIAQNPAQLDPQIAEGAAAEMVLNNSFEGLVRLGADGEILPGVAKSWNISADGKVYTFTLREDTHWYFSKANQSLFSEEEAERFSALVTAQDFVFGLRRAVTPQIAAPFAQNLSLIRGAQESLSGKASPNKIAVEATGQFTLTITLTRASADFLRVLTTPVALPCNEVFYNAAKGRYGLDYTNLLCNGPFFVYRWDSEKSLTLRRNPNYRHNPDSEGKNEVLPASLTFVINPDTASYAEKLQSGTYAAAALWAESMGDAAQWADGFTVTKKPDRVLSLLFHCGNPLLKNTTLRIALVTALRREELTAATAADSPAAGLIPPGCTLGSAAYRVQAGEAKFAAFSEKAAKASYQKALAELGKTELRAKLLCPAEYETALRQVLQRWQKVFGMSFQLSVEITDTQTMEEQVRSGDFALALYPLNARQDLALDFLQSFAAGAPENLSRYNSKTYDGLLEKIRSAPSDEEALRGCRQAEEHLLQNAVILPLFTRESLYVLGRGVSGVYFLPDGETICFLSGRFID